MIKINLLPPNLYEGKVIRNIGIAFGLLAVIVIAGFLYWNSTIVAATNDMTAKANVAKGFTDQGDLLKSQASTMRAEIKPLQDKVKFFQDVAKHNNAYVDLYGELARFTFRRVVYSQVTLAADGSMQLQGTAPRLGDIARYMMNLYGATSLFKSITLSQAPTLAVETTNAQPGGAPPAPGGVPQLPPVSPMAPPSYPAGGIVAPGYPGSAPGSGLAAAEQGGAPAPGYAPTLQTAGMGAIQLTEQRATARAKIRYTFSLQCAITDQWKTAVTAPLAPGMAAPAVGGMPGMAPPPMTTATAPPPPPGP